MSFTFAFRVAVNAVFCRRSRESVTKNVLKISCGKVSRRQWKLSASGALPGTLLPCASGAGRALFAVHAHICARCAFGRREYSSFILSVCP
jgi:hypothetical protein